MTSSLQRCPSFSDGSYQEGPANGSFRYAVVIVSWEVSEASQQIFSVIPLGSHLQGRDRAPFVDTEACLSYMVLSVRTDGIVQAGEILHCSDNMMSRSDLDRHTDSVVVWKIRQTQGQV